MLLIELTHDHDLRPLPFYLAMEQWAAQSFPDEEVLFTWRVRPTVICGRHQCIEAEVDLAYCRSRGIDVVRRRSGGGCVYADPDNLMISYIAPMRGRSVQEVFRGYAERVASTLRCLGVEANVEGRNDITIGSRKVSGFAFYLPSPVTAIAHGTMLFAVDTATMSRAITPARGKLISKGVPSVASRVTTLGEHAPGLTIEAFRQALREGEDCRTVSLTAAEEAEVREIELTYRDPAWVTDRRMSLSGFMRQGRVECAGLVRIDAALDSDGTIAAAAITGDFFCPDSTPASIERQLIGQRPGAVAITDTSAIAGLTPRELEEIINSEP